MDRYQNIISCFLASGQSNIYLCIFQMCCIPTENAILFAKLMTLLKNKPLCIIKEIEPVKINQFEETHKTHQINKSLTVFPVSHLIMLLSMVLMIGQDGLKDLKVDFWSLVFVKFDFCELCVSFYYP